MKKVSLFFLTLLTAVVFGQSFILTPQNLVNSDDNSKSYLVLEFPEKKQAELFRAAKLFLNTKYNNPKFVTTEVENEQIVINASAPNAAKIRAGIAFDINYNAAISFREGKIKIDLSIKDYERYTTVNKYGGGREKDNLIGFDMGISKTGIFSQKGKTISAKGKETTENFANNFVLDLKEGINKNLSSNDSDW